MNKPYTINNLVSATFEHLDKLKSDDPKIDSKFCTRHDSLYIDKLYISHDIQVSKNVKEYAKFIYFKFRKEAIVRGATRVGVYVVAVMLSMMKYDLIKTFDDYYKNRNYYCDQCGITLGTFSKSYKRVMKTFTKLFSIDSLLDKDKDKDQFIINI